MTVRMEPRQQLAVLNVVILCAVIQSMAVRQVCCLCGFSRSSIQLLVVLPLHTQPFQERTKGEEGATDADLFPPWDRGLEILPAAYVAANQVNGVSSLLASAKLEVVAVNSSLCDDPVGSESSTLASMVREITKKRRDDQCIVGVAGLFREASTALLSSVATTIDFHLLQLSGSASPLFQLQSGSNKFPLLYQMVASTSTYCDAVLALMEVLSWERIAIVSEMFPSYYTSAANQCYKTLTANVSNRVAFFGAVISRDHTEIIANLRVSGHRISLISTNAELAANILCYAYGKNMRWPQYAWIMYDHTPSDLLPHSTACSTETMSLALEGAFFLQYKLDAGEPGGRVELGQTMRDYEVTYDSSLREMETANGLAHGSLQRNKYANVLYDSVWALALALNSSSTVHSCSASNQHKVVNDARKHLDNISFTGVSGLIEFKERQVATPVTLYHYSNKSVVTIGYYYNGELSEVNQSYLHSQEIPSDEIPHQYILFSVPITVLLLFVVAFFILASVVMLVLFLIFRSEPEIKATSPFLSLILFLGCFFLFFSISVNDVFNVMVVKGTIHDTACGVFAWLSSLGLNFIFATLLVRMVRIYHIFNHPFRQMGRLWSDWTLFGTVMVIAGFVLVPLLTWTIVDPYIITDVATFVSTAKSPPYYQVVQQCESKYEKVWLGLIYTEIGVLLIALVILAVKTRKIKNNDFKDTKKVNAYVFISVVELCLLFPLWWTLHTVGDYLGGNTITYLGLGCPAVLCQLFLFAPKVYPPLLRHVHSKAHGKASALFRAKAMHV